MKTFRIAAKAISCALKNLDDVILRFVETPFGNLSVKFLQAYVFAEIRSLFVALLDLI